jgi:tetratricopeptide (TPR) repeat protein
VILLHGFVDSALYSSRALPLLFVPMGLALPRSAKESADAVRSHTLELLRRAWLPTLLAVLSLCVLIFPPLRADLYANIGAVLQTRAELRAYSWPQYPIQDAVRRDVDLSVPVRYLERAQANDGTNATANRRLGLIDLSLGDYERALEHLTTAFTVEAHSQTTRQLLGEALIANGRRDDGAELWSTVDNAQDQLTIRAWWYRHIGDERRAKWFAEVLETL